MRRAAEALARHQLKQYTDVATSRLAMAAAAKAAKATEAAATTAGRHWKIPLQATKTQACT